MRLDSTRRLRERGVVSRGAVHSDEDEQQAVHTYTRHGKLEGRAQSISEDAILREGAEPVYQLRIELLDDAVVVDGKRKRVRPGMTLVAEMRAGERRAYEYFLDPFLLSKDEGLRERICFMCPQAAAADFAFAHWNLPRQLALLRARAARSPGGGLVIVGHEQRCSNGVPGRIARKTRCFSAVSWKFTFGSSHLAELHAGRR